MTIMAKVKVTVTANTLELTFDRVMPLFNLKSNISFRNAMYDMIQVSDIGPQWPSCLFLHQS